MRQGEHSSILWTFIKLPFVIKTFILSFSEWPFTQVLLFISFPVENNRLIHIGQLYWRQQFNSKYFWQNGLINSINPDQPAREREY